MTTSRFRRSLLAGAIGIGSIAGLAAGTAGASVPDGASHPSRASGFARLTDAQRTCLTDAGLTRPTGRPTAEQRQQLRDTAASCGVAIPRRGGTAARTHRSEGWTVAALTDAQRTCLTDAGFTRPTGRPTAEQRQQLRDAAAECGITIPRRGGPAHAAT